LRKGLLERLVLAMRYVMNDYMDEQDQSSHENAQGGISLALPKHEDGEKVANSGDQRH
jgi:hypothetical protein